MLKYLIVQLDDTSISFCHYENGRTENKLIPLDALKEAIIWSMKENLMVQFIYPDCELPENYTALIDKIEHVDIISSKNRDRRLKEQAQITVFDNIGDINNYDLKGDGVYVVRGTFNEFVNNSQELENVIGKVSRLNLLLTDIPRLNPEMETSYVEFLDIIGESVKREYAKGHAVQLNVLTDRIMLDGMNNCNAGDEVITLAPDGKFYICPAFYLEGDESVGSLKKGLKIKNRQLYKLSHAPICRECDAYQCNRCVWLNKKQTLEVNTPGMQQCVTSHLERNAAQRLMKKLRELGEFMPEKEIPDIDYLDPFDKVVNQKY